MTHKKGDGKMESTITEKELDVINSLKNISEEHEKLFEEIISLRRQLYKPSETDYLSFSFCVNSMEINKRILEEELAGKMLAEKIKGRE